MHAGNALRPEAGRRRPPSLLLVAGILAGILAGCRGEAAPGSTGDDTTVGTDRLAMPPEAPPDGPITVRDDAGREVRFPGPPRRILSLVPSATPILLALGAGDRLVGRTDFDHDPSLAHLPSVGGGLGPSTEAIVALAPDLVVHFDAGSDPGTPSRLDAAGIPHLAIRPDRIEDVFRITELLGRVLDREAAADSLRSSIEAELAAVAAAAGPPVRVAILLGGDPPLVAGGGTFLHELATLAGARNVLAEVGPLYIPVSVEAILRAEPELLLLSEGTAVPRGLEGLPTRLVPLDVQLPGPNLGEGARRLQALLPGSGRP